MWFATRALGHPTQRLAQLGSCAECGVDLCDVSSGHDEGVERTSHVVQRHISHQSRPAQGLDRARTVRGELDAVRHFVGAEIIEVCDLWPSALCQ